MNLISEIDKALVPVPDNIRPAFSSRVEEVAFILDKSLEFRYCVITGRVEFSMKGAKDFKPFTDREFNTVRKYLLQYYFDYLPEGDLRCVIESDFSKPYDPIKNFFDSLPTWDGNNFIEKLASLITAKEGQYGEDVDAQQIWTLYLHRWLIASVATMLQCSINHTCLTLLGPQGIGKTSFLRSLGIDPSLVYVGGVNPSDRDSKILYSEKTLIILDELESTTKYELSALKSNMTLPEITVRRPYGRMAEVLPRRASFAACANEVHVLGDLTGSRRWLCVEVERIEYMAITPDLMKNVYAQALAAFKAGVKYWFSDDEILMLEKANAHFYAPCPEEEALLVMYEPTDFKNLYAEYKTNTELIDDISTANTGVRFSSKKLGEILKRHGFERGKRDGLYKYAIRRK